MRLRISSRLTESLLSRTNHPLPLFAIPNRFSRASCLSSLKHRALSSEQCSASPFPHPPYRFPARRCGQNLIPWLQKQCRPRRMPEPSLILNSLMGLYYALPGHFDDLIEPGTHVDWTEDQSDIGDFGKVEGRHRTTSDVIRMRAAANCSGAAVAKFRRAPPWSSN